MGALVLLVTAPAPAAAQGDEQARIHFESGREYYSSARYAEAQREFEEAYRLSGRIELLINASRAAERNLDFTGAIALVDRFLEEAAPDHPERERQTERRAQLEELRTRVESQEGETEPEFEDPTQTGEPAGGLGGLGYAGIGVAGGGAALGLVSLVTGIVAKSRYDDLEASCDPDGVCPPDRASDISSGRRLARTSTATTMIGIAGIAAGIVLIILDDGPSDDAAPAATEARALRITDGPGDVGLGAELTF